MKRLIGPIALSIILGLVAHFAVVHYAPAFIMDRAYAMLGQRGTPVHGFMLAPRMTPSTQSVVRPSPDLAYSACRFDLSQAPGGVLVRMAGYDGYSSLSFFDAQTNNFRTVRGNGAAHETLLVPAASTPANDAHFTLSPSSKGIILIRRLAPSDETYAKVVEASAGDHCVALVRTPPK